MNADDVLARAWQVYKARLGVCMGAVWGVIGLMLFYQFLVYLFLDRLAARHGPPASVATGRRAEVSEIFSGGPYLVSTVLASILFGFATAGVVFACLVPAVVVIVATGRPSLAAFLAGAGGVAAAALSVIVLAIRLSQFAYVIADRNAGPVTSLQFSGRVTKGNGVQIVLVGLTLMLVNVAGALACLVGLVFTLPLSLLTAAVLYATMTGQRPDLKAGAGTFLPGLKPMSGRDFDGIL